MRFLFRIVFLLVISSSAKAITPELVRDLNPALANFGAEIRDLCSEFVEFNNDFYFCAESATGAELWISDGTSAGTNRVTADYAPQSLFVYAGELYFIDQNTSGLFRSDGSASGTSLIRDFNRATLLTEVNGRLLLVAEESNGDFRLWATDGTSAGTNQLSDAFPSFFSLVDLDFDSSEIAKVGNKVFFVANNGTNGEELWVTQGTAETTFLVRDIRPGSSSAAPSQLTALGNQVTFFARDDTGTSRLWVSDGTEDGTINLTQEFRFHCSDNLIVAQNATVYFCASGSDLSGAELWATDGTINGTRLVKDINVDGSGSFPNLLLATESHVFFTARENNASLTQLWVTDGSESGTISLTSRTDSSVPDIDAVSEVSGNLYFIAELDNRGVALWLTDIENQTVALVEDFDTELGPFSSFISSFTESDTEVLGSSENYDYFVLDLERNTPTSLWRLERSNSTISNIGSFSELSLPSEADDTQIEYFFAAESQVFFAAYDPKQIGVQRIWQDNGIDAEVLVEVQPTELIMTSSSQVSNFVEFQRQFYFLTSDAGQSGAVSLWVSGGTTENTIKIRELCERSCDFENAEIVSTRNGIFALIDSQDLWFSDGTTEGTSLIKQVGDSTFSTFRRANTLTVVGSQVFFAGWEPDTGIELWKSDGSTAGTVLVKDINPGSPSSFRGGQSNSDRLDDLTDFAVIGNSIYFVADDNVTGPELWRSRGTASTTAIVKDIFEGSTGSFPQDITAVGTTLFFSAFTLDEGYELWKSNGTANSTELVRDIEPRTFTETQIRFTCETVGFIEFCRDREVQVTLPFSSLPKGIQGFGNKAIFRAYTITHGYETWVTDGTNQGTFLLRDIQSGQNGSSDFDIPPTDGDFEEDINNIRRWEQGIVIGNELFFAAIPDDERVQLWRTDGTRSGTRLVRTIGNSNFVAQEITQFAVNTNGTNDFYFTVGSDTDNTQLWQYNESRNSAFEFTNQPSPSLNYFGNLFFFNSELYLSASNGIKGRSLWTIITDTDGDGAADRVDGDDDDDGLPDSFEIEFGFNPLDPSDALLDSDGDGRDNLTEYRQRTNPLVPDDARPFVISPILHLLFNE